jgi:hypothetical protein
VLRPAQTDVSYSRGSQVGAQFSRPGPTNKISSSQIKIRRFGESQPVFGGGGRTNLVQTDGQRGPCIWDRIKEMPKSDLNLTASTVQHGMAGGAYKAIRKLLIK